MASLIYDSYFGDLTANNINPSTDTFKVMLVTSSYAADQTHAKRSNITNEVTGTGYTAGGASATLTVVTTDTTNHRADITLGGASWSSSTITARGAVYYKSRGGASSADELVAYIDFGSDVVSSSGTFTLNSSTLRIQN